MFLCRPSRCARLSKRRWPFDWGISRCLCVHLDPMAGERAGWPPDPSLLGVRSSCQRVNERCLLGARRASAKWPGRMTTLCSDPHSSLQPSVKHPLLHHSSVFLLPPPPRVKLKPRFVQLLRAAALLPAQAYTDTPNLFEEMQIFKLKSLLTKSRHAKSASSSDFRLALILR